MPRSLRWRIAQVPQRQGDEGEEEQQDQDDAHDPREDHPSLAELRAVVDGLRTPDVDRDGLLPAIRSLADLLSRVDVLVPNEHELVQLAGTGPVAGEDLVALARKVTDRPVVVSVAVQGQSSVDIVTGLPGPGAIQLTGPAVWTK